MSDPRIDCGICVLRRWSEDDIEPLPLIANDWMVARYMTDLFPHPYTPADARSWIDQRLADCETQMFAIEADGKLAGGVGFHAQDNEKRRTAQIGYWLGRDFWGRGIATAALRVVSKRAFATTDILRLEAGVYHPNVASMRVLEKCAYEREGVMRSAVVKRGEIYDAVMYAKLRS